MSTADERPRTVAQAMREVGVNDTALVDDRLFRFSCAVCGKSQTLKQAVILPGLAPGEFARYQCYRCGELAVVTSDWNAGHLRAGWRRHRIGDVGVETRADVFMKAGGHSIPLPSEPC